MNHILANGGIFQGIWKLKEKYLELEDKGGQNPFSYFLFLFFFCWMTKPPTLLKEGKYFYIYLSWSEISVWNWGLGVFDTCAWKHVFCCLKTYVEICVSKKVYRNACNVYLKTENVCLNGYNNCSNWSIGNIRYYISHLDACLSPCICNFFFFFFFAPLVHGTWTMHLSLWTITYTILARRLHCTWDIVPCTRTVHGTHNHFIQKKILKMGPTILFIHLKIILLQYFQFSIFSKISCIQTDPWCHNS